MSNPPDSTRLQELADRGQALDREAVGLRNAGHRVEAAAAAHRALEIWRELHAALPGSTVAPHLASSLNNLGAMLSELGRREEALAAAEEALAIRRALARENPQVFALDLAKSLSNLSIWLHDLNRRDEALAVAEEAVAHWRVLAEQKPQAFAPDLATSLNNLGVRLSEIGRRGEALAATEESAKLYRALAHANPRAFTPDLAMSLDNLGADLSALGRRADALAVSQEAVKLYRALSSANPQAFTPDLGRSLDNLGSILTDVGRHQEALAAANEAVQVNRALAGASPDQSKPALARSLLNLGRNLSALGRGAEALATTVEAVGLYRALTRVARQAHAPGLAGSLNNLGRSLLALGRREDAIAVAEEAVGAYRELAGTHPHAFARELARSLSTLGASLHALGRRESALAAIEEALGLRRDLASAKQQDVLSDLAMSLNDMGVMLSGLGRLEQALTATQEAVTLYRALARGSPQAFKPSLAGSLNNLGAMLRELGRREEALATAEEAAALRRELATANPRAFAPDLITSLVNLARSLNELGRDVHAVSVLREVGTRVLPLHPVDPYHWRGLCRAAFLNLRTPQDLREFHLPLLRLLTEHRELAWSSEHAYVFLGLQAEVAMRVWELLVTLPAEEGDLLDEAVAALVGTLHSPDLVRWLEARGSGEGRLTKLAELKREVIEAEQLLATLRKGLPSGGDAGWRDSPSGPNTEAQRAALLTEFDRQSAQAQVLRQAFRDERARLEAEDLQFASAFEPIGAQALRSIARHARGGALLCVLELGGDGVGRTEPTSPDRRRSVAALLHADGRRTQLLELAGVHELAWHALNHRPEALGRAGRGPLRGAPVAGVRSSSDDPAPPPITDLLAPRMSGAFWAPLQQALQASGVSIERLHVCLHGTMQQLPLALRQEDDCAGLHVTAWPGLPYLRRAAMAAGTGANAAAGESSSPWLVGHDCAWGSEQPLPMVAVEAALLRDLLQRHGQPVQAIQRAAQLKGQPSALVACCHGGAEQAQFDHALHLGPEPLTVRQIVQDSIGPPLALLPACHAGRTDEDAAGNALGVAAAFMLSGTQVVSASSKAVPDLLQPWLSTLTVWHAMQGLPHHEAATLAREQFARLEFPDAYRSWLQEALPQALATIQPGGEEDPHIRGVHAHLALEQVQERWPWEGDTKHLFHADGALRDEATRSVVRGVLRPRGGEEGARALTTEAREMAAFVFVYGVAQTASRSDADRAVQSAQSAQPTSPALADLRSDAGIAPSAVSTTGDAAPPHVADPLDAAPPASGLQRLLRRLIGK